VINMLYTVLKKLRHFYPVSYDFANAIVADGISGSFDSNDFIAGMYVLIKNSLLNDGVYKVSGVASNKLTVDATLQAESTDRIIKVYGLAIPPDLVSLVSDIESYVADNPYSNVSSESLGDYSISYGTNADGASASDWYNAFKSKLSHYQRFYSDLDSFIPSKKWW